MKEIITTHINSLARNGMPEKPEEFIEWWQMQISQVPVEYLPSARILIEAIGCDDDVELDVTIVYQRPETDEEENSRMDYEKEMKAIIEKRDLEQLARLKLQYEKS